MLLFAAFAGCEVFGSVDGALKVEIVGGDGLSWAAVAGWLGTLAASFWALYQWNTSRRVARMQYLDDRIKLLREDSAIAGATQLLDYDGGVIKLGETRYAYSVRELPRALMPHELLPADEIFTLKEKAIRDAFDAFFDFLDGLGYAVKLGIIAEKDVWNSSVEYYLNKMLEKDRWTAQWETERTGRKSEGAITLYLRSYRINRALELFENYNRSSVSSGPLREFTPEYAKKIEESFAKAQQKISEDEAMGDS